MPNNPFDDILQPQPRSGQQTDVDNDPFEDQPGPTFFDSRNHAYTPHQSTATANTRDEADTLDPFFDEYVLTTMCQSFRLTRQ
jgi:hypothetical protein